MKLTSSNFAAAMGISPWCSRQKLFRQMTGRENRDPLNAAMQWGIDNECRAVAAAEAMTGLLFQHTGDDQQHYQLNVDGIWFGTTPDGRCGSTGLEVKCPQKLTDEPPLHYIPQVQGQMWLAGFDTVIFGQWTPDESRFWRVGRSEEYIDQMRGLLGDFIGDLSSDNEPKRRKKPVMPEVNFERIET